MRCAYCANDDHTRLGGLVAHAEESHQVAVEAGGIASSSAASPPRFARSAKTADPTSYTTVETCLDCRGYLKTVTTLGPTAADELGLLDLATVELDVAALQHGYTRPGGPGMPLGARVRLRTGGIFGARR
jgi:hypothetical protein